MPLTQKEEDELLALERYVVAPTRYTRASNDAPVVWEPGWSPDEVYKKVNALRDKKGK